MCGIHHDRKLALEQIHLTIKPLPLMREPKGPDLPGWNHPRHPLACDTINLQRIQQGIIQVKVERRRESGFPLMSCPSNNHNATTIPRPQDFTDAPSPFDWNRLFAHSFSYGIK